MNTMTKKEKLLRIGFSRINKTDLYAYLNESEMMTIYKAPLLKYGIDCGCPFTEDEVTDFIANQFQALNEIENRHSA